MTPAEEIDDLRARLAHALNQLEYYRLGEKNLIERAERAEARAAAPEPGAAEPAD